MSLFLNFRDLLHSLRNISQLFIRPYYYADLIAADFSLEKYGVFMNFLIEIPSAVDSKLQNIADLIAADFSLEKYGVSTNFLIEIPSVVD